MSRSAEDLEDPIVKDDDEGVRAWIKDQSPMDSDSPPRMCAIDLLVMFGPAQHGVSISVDRARRLARELDEICDVLAGKRPS